MKSLIIFIRQKFVIILIGLAAGSGFLFQNCIGPAPVVQGPQTEVASGAPIESETYASASVLFDPDVTGFDRDSAVKLRTNDSRCLVFYSLDNTIPKSEWQQYSSPIEVRGDGKELTIFAFLECGAVQSSVVSRTFHVNYLQVAAPVFSVQSGNFVEGNSFSVSLNTATEGASIYYLNDPLEFKEPYEVEPHLYVGKPIHVSGNSVLKAFAVKKGMKRSDVTSVHYAFSPVPGVVASQDEIAPIHCSPVASFLARLDNPNAGYTDSQLLVRTGGPWGYEPLVPFDFTQPEPLRDQVKKYFDSSPQHWLKTEANLTTDEILSALDIASGRYSGARPRPS
jgi:hypothetical protein